MKIIPAIDLINGKCVRLYQGDYTKKKVYNSDPVAVAKQFFENGFEYLHLVDLDGARLGRVVNHQILKAISGQTGLKIDFGGGVKSQEDLELVFESGASQVNLGSLAYQAPEKAKQWISKYGSHKFIISSDVNLVKSSYLIAIDGWQTQTKQKIQDFISFYTTYNLKTFTVTDISKDGSLKGPNFQLYQNLLKTNPGIQLIASGGISSLQDIQKLKEIGLYGCIVGKAIYENKVSLGDLLKL